MTENEFIKLVPHLRQLALESGRRAGASAEEAEDIAQEVIIRLWQMSDRLETLASPDAFAATLSRHLAIDSFRKSRKFAGNVEALPDSVKIEGPDAAMETKDNLAWLERKLQDLPSTEYALLHMRQVERLSAKEMARRLGIRETSVATLLSRARRRLLEEIRKRK